MKPSAPFPLSRTKVSLPRRREHLLARPRLLGLLNQFIDKKLILITAPAGYGKTSLLVDFASRCELQVCWLALDELDRDPQRFITYFIAALAERFPAFGAESMAALNRLVSLEDDLESLVVTITNEMYDTIREHFLLVLDDYHLVEAVETIRGFLSRFVKLSDENCHLALSSRRLSHLSDLPRMIADEQVEGLDFAELAFRPDEIRSLFLQNHNLELTEESVRELAEQSEGWITGLQLVGFSSGMTGRIRVARATGMDLNQYFDEQVLARQSSTIRSILLYTSLFDEFDADLCRAVLADLFPERLNWSSLLGFILENNLFVLPVGLDGRWLRYHHLFRDFLRTRLQEEHADKIHVIQSRLVSSYEARGEWERAYHICRQFNDSELLAGLIEHAGPTMLRRAVVTLTDWLNALPPALANSRPGLLSLRGGIGYLRGNYREALSLLNQAEAIYRTRAETPGFVLTLVRRAMAHFNLGDYNSALRDAEEALLRTENAPDLQLDHAEAQRIRGLALLRLGRTRQALECFERSLALYTHLKERDSIPILLLNCGMAYRALGNYKAAEESYQKALGIWRKDGNLAWQANALNNLGFLYHNILGEYEKANLSFREGLTCAIRCRYLQTEAMISIGVGELYAELGEYEGARQFYEQAGVIAREMEDRFLLNYLPLAQSALFLLQNDTDRAERVLAESLPAIEAGNSQYEMGLWSLRRGWLSLARNEPDSAVAFLNKARQYFTDDGRELETQWSCVWLAAALSAAGKIAEARTVFKSVLNGASSVPHALVAVIRLARPWLGALLADASIGKLAAPLFLQAERLEARMASLRRELRRTPQTVTLSAPRLNIHSLGWTKVTVNTRPVEWPTQSVRELFFFFLTSSKPLSKEQVAEVLWPDLEDPERIKQRFKNELYRLRRAVGPDIILLDGDLYRFNRSLDYDHDLDDFETYLTRARSAQTDAERIENYEKAVNLVNGVYLADIGAAWAIIDRERIQRTFLEAAIELAELYEKVNNPEKMLETCRRALELDPAHEPAHQLAMRAHAARGDRKAVARQYQLCRDESLRLFNLPPTEETENLYRRLIS
jgi:ATP/maltotriose-dependent transcriptional regulator MalT/two-component SAPR family response regulator